MVGRSVNARTPANEAHDGLRELRRKAQRLSEESRLMREKLTVAREELHELLTTRYAADSIFADHSPES